MVRLRRNNISWVMPPPPSKAPGWPPVAAAPTPLPSALKQRIAGPDESPRLDPTKESLVVKRGRRVSVIAGSMKSARESVEREKDTQRKAVQELRLSASELREKLAANLSSLGAFFVYFDEARSGQVTKHSFQSVVQAIGLPTDACAVVFDEFDTGRSGIISYADFLQFFLRDSLARAAVRVTDLCRVIDHQGARTGKVGKDEFRLAIRRLGWEMPSIYLLDAIFDSMDVEGEGTLTFNQLTKMLRMGTAEDLADELHKQRVMMGPNMQDPVSKGNRFPVRRGSLAEQFEANMAIWYPRMPKRNRRDSFDGPQPEKAFGRRVSMAGKGRQARRKSVNTPTDGRRDSLLGGPGRRDSFLPPIFDQLDDPLANAVGDADFLRQTQGKRRSSVALRRPSNARPLPAHMMRLLEEEDGPKDSGAVSLPALSARTHGSSQKPSQKVPTGSLSARARLPAVF